MRPWSKRRAFWGGSALEREVLSLPPPGLEGWMETCGQMFLFLAARGAG